jgi:hypothetical protein
VSSLPLAETIRKPAPAKAATMRDARASGSPRAVSLIVFAMIRSTAGTSAFCMSFSSLPPLPTSAAPVRLPTAGWPPLVKRPICGR